MATKAEIDASIKLRDEFSAHAKRIHGQMVKMERQLKRNHLSFAKLTAAFAAGGAVMRVTGKAFREISGFISGSIQASSDFNDAMTKSTAIMGDLSNTMRTEMAAAAKEVSQITTFSATQAAEAYYFLASAGLDAAQSIGALPQVSKFAQAGAFDLARATDLLTDAQSALGMSSKDTAQNMENMTRVSDVLVKANTLANASVEQFSQSLTNKAGAALKILNKDVEEGVAVLAAFADQGVKAQDAGTALNIVLRDLSTKALANEKAFKANGIAVFDAAGNMRNIADIISDIENRLAGMSDAQAKATLLQLGFADKSVIFIQTLLGMSDKIREYEGELRKAAGTTEEVANKQLQSFASQAKLTGQAWENLQKAAGDFVTQSEAIKEILAGARKAFERLEKSLIDNRESWVKLVSGGIVFFMDATSRSLSACAYTITAASDLGRAISNLQELFINLTETIATDPMMKIFVPGLRNASGAIDEWVKTSREAIETERDVADAMKEMATNSFIASDKLDALVVDITNATGAQLANIEAEKEAARIKRDVAKALDELGDAFDNVGDAVNQNIEFIDKYGERLTDVIPESLIENINHIEAKFGWWSNTILYVKSSTEEAAGALVSFTETMQQAAALTTIFGKSAGGVFGGIASMAGGLEGLFERSEKGKFMLPTKFMNEAGKTSFASFLGGMASAIPMIGAIAGPAIALLGKLFGRGWKKIAKEGARIFGKELSENLSKEIQKVAKRLDSVHDAMAARIGDIVSEVGVTGENVQQVARHMDSLLSMVSERMVDFHDATKQLTKAFGPLVQELENLGDTGTIKIGMMVKKMRELGLITAEVQKQINEWISQAIPALGRYFGYLTEKTEKGVYKVKMGVKEAKNAVLILSAALRAALEVSDSLYEAVLSLPESFEELIKRIGGMLGETDEAFLRIRDLYNFIKNNQAALGAIQALGDAIRFLGKAGFLTEKDLRAFAEAMKTEWDLLIGKGFSLEQILAAIGPNIALMYQWFEKMGMDVPGWLEDIGEDLKGIEPPRSTEDILGKIEEILYKMAVHMGAIVEDTEKWSELIRDFPPFPGGPREGPAPGRPHPRPGGPKVSAAAGMFEKLKKDTMILAHAGELAAVIPKNIAGRGDVVFRTAQAGMMEETGAYPSLMQEEVRGRHMRPEVSEGILAAAAPKYDSLEIAQVMGEAMGKAMAKERKPDVNVMSRPTFDMHLPEFTARQTTEVMRDIYVPELKRMLRNDTDGLASLIREIVE